MYANYQYSLTSEEQAAIQIWLRLLPRNLQHTPAWELLHDLTYAESWTEEPKFPLPQEEKEEHGVSKAD